MSSSESKPVTNVKGKSLEKKVTDSQKGFSDKQKRISDVVDGEILQCNIKVNRDHVVAEREARKKAKQQTKHRAKECEKALSNNSHDKCLVDNSTVLVTTSSVKPIIDEGTCKINVDVNNDLSSKTNKDLIKLHQSDSQENKNVNNKTTSNEDSSKSGRVEKTREDVIAEREAKKKAKQLAKLNKNTEQGSKTSVAPVTIVNNNVKDIETNHSAIQDKNPEGKSKAELKAERRAKQEAQRAAKEAEKRQKTEVIENKENHVQVSVKQMNGEAPKESLPEMKHLTKTKSVMQQRIKLFSHLHLGQKPSQIQMNQNVHPLVIQLGLKYSSRVICGSNSRCVALLACLKEVIRDYTTPLEKEFSRGLESKLAEITNYLNQCRPISVSMTNALRHIKSHLTQLPNDVSDDEAKRKLLDVIDTFIREQIDVAGEAICESVTRKITNGDVILTYSSSSLLYRILIESHRSGKEFSVVVVDGGPWFEGREMLRKLVTAGLNCTYVQVSAVNFIMKQATKVLFGAHALLANGSVMSRAGTALVALAAKSCNVPVLVCCETYKFCERVQTDSFVYNELGSPDDLVKCDERLSNWQSLNLLSPLSIVYDITPPDLVTGVVTELAILPCTSVPVILRIKPSDVTS